MLQMNLEEAIAKLKKAKAKKVLIQVPEGLKTRTEEIISQLEKEGFTTAAAMDPCFGACDIKQDEAIRMGFDAILHIGHTEFVQKPKITIAYAPLKYELEEAFEIILKKIVEKLKKEKIKEAGLTAPAQYLHYLPQIKKALAREGVNAEIGKGKRVEDGQVLGCNYSSANVKAKTIIYFGDGYFHPLGIHFATQKRVLIADPLGEEVRELDKEKDDFLRKRILMIEKAKSAKEYVIIVSTKEGQSRMQDAARIKKEIESTGKCANILIIDFISYMALLGTKAEAIINTACPRISIDDYEQYKLPIINKNEVDYLLGKKKYENYSLEEVY